MNKLDISEGQSFSIKGVDGNEYTFSDGSLYIDTPKVEKSVEEEVKVLKSLRTRSGAESWARVAGFSYRNLVVEDSETLKSLGLDIPSEYGFHVVVKSDAVEVEEEIGELSEEGAGFPVDPGAFARQQLRQILDDAEELACKVEDLQSWDSVLQSNIAAVTEYLSDISDMIAQHTGSEASLGELYLSLGGAPRGDDWKKAPGLGGKQDESDGKGGRVRKPDVEKSSKKAESDEKPSKGKGGKEEKDYQKKVKEVNAVVGEGKNPPDKLEDVIGEDGREVKKSSEEEESSAPDVLKGKMAELSEEESSKKKELESEQVTKEDMEEEPNPKGKVFKSMHAAKQWNRFENPDPDRFYLDILRQKDARSAFTKSFGLNAKYVVRDRLDDPEPVMKGAFGNRKVAPEKKIDAKTKEVCAIKASSDEQEEENE